MRLGAIAVLSALFTSCSTMIVMAQDAGVEPAPPRDLKNRVPAAAPPPLKLLYAFSGVRDGASGPWAIATALMCSNNSPTPINARFRVFSFAGPLLGNVAFTVQPQTTSTIV